MLPKHFHLICLCLFLFSFVPPKLHANSQKPSPFDFIKQLEGSQKGQKLNGIDRLRDYLERFGYLAPHKSRNQAQPNNNNVFDDSLESAIKSYQFNYHLEVTGTLDAATVANMIMPRCGVADIINGTNQMQAGKKQPNPEDGPIAASQYSFTRGNPRWPAGMTHLTYWLPSNTYESIADAVGRAFNQWASVSKFTFSRTQNFRSANLVVHFARRNHGDGYPFDGPGGVLAHSFAPQDGRFHLDVEEKWSIGAIPDYFDLETVSLHEIGHLLGLGHSSVEESIMYPYISSGVTKGLYEDDIDGINVLYYDD